MEQALIEFNLHVQNMLCGEGAELTQREKDIEKLLANNLLLDQQDEVTTHLIKSAGCMQPDIHVKASDFKQEHELTEESGQVDCEIVKPLIQKTKKHEKKTSKLKKPFLCY